MHDQQTQKAKLNIMEALKKSEEEIEGKQIALMVFFEVRERLKL